MRNRGVLILLAVLACASSFCITARAQLAAVEGFVIGEDGKPVVGAEILIERMDIRQNFKVKTDKRGHYYHGGIPAFGTYTLTLVINGEKRSSLKGLQTNKSSNEHDFNLKADSERQAGQAAPAGGQPAQGERLSKEQREEIQQQLEKENVSRDKMGKLNQLFADGVEAVRTGTFDVAIARLEEAAQLAPEQGMVWANLGEAYMGAGRAKQGSESQALFQKSVEAYEKAVTLKPDDPGVHNNFGLALAYSGQIERAEQELGKAAALDPPNTVRYFFNLGAVLANSGRMKEAAGAFRKATEANPTHADSWYQLGLSLSGGAQLDEKTGAITPVPGTVEALEKYIALQPNGPFVESAKSLIASFNVTVETEFKKKKGKK